MLPTSSVRLPLQNSSSITATAKEMTEAGYEVLSVAGDVSKWEDNERMLAETIAHFGRLDILVNNAGASTRGSVEKMAPEVFQNMTNVNILGSVFPTKVALSHLKQNKGSVIFIGSLAGLHGLPYNSIYSATKMALTAVSESLRNEVKSDGIHVGIAYVGFTENDPEKIIYDADGKLIYLEERKGLKKQTPQQVAVTIRNMILKRKKKAVLSPAGKFLYFANRLFPGLIDRIFYSRIDTIKANSEGKPRYVQSGN
ncbi:MAG: SDR family NAD(P)-dependent oxidoreductase [Bacteroidota bacterium]